MRAAAALAILAIGLSAGGAAAETAAAAPVLKGSSATPAQAPGDPELLVFKGTLLLNEFVYRAVLKLPDDAKATPRMARRVTAELAAFLRDAGYVLAKVRARVQGKQIEVTVDEGALDKIIFVGAGWITALRFRGALNLPLDIFNRRLFDLQMPRLADRFGLRGYTFELWPVHPVDPDAGPQLDDMEELRAMPLIRPARGYELRIFAQTDPWGTGFSPEVVLGGSIGYGIGGRYRWQDLFQDGDRWQLHLRTGGAFRSSLDPSGSTRFVNSSDFVSARWLSKPWGGSRYGLRLTVSPQVQLWTSQRADLMLESYRLGVLELGAGGGAQLSPNVSFFFALGMQRRWIYDVEAALGTTLAPDVTRVPKVSNRGFLRLSSQYTFNPAELRQDQHDVLGLELSTFAPTVSGDTAFLRFDLQGRRVFHLGWNELRAGVHVSGELGDVWFIDEIPLEDHLRIGFGLVKYTHRVGSTSLEFRYSLLRDKVKLGVFNDLGVWRHLPRDDAAQTPQLAGSFGGGAFLFILDELQIDAYYGAGWSTDSSIRTGFALAIKEAF